MSRALQKIGTLDLPDYRKWVSEQECCGCGAPGPSDCHHFPTRGATRGAVNDLRTAPLCRSCHARAGGMRVVRSARDILEPFSATDQALMVSDTFFRFLESAPAALADTVILAWRAWRESRYTEVVPW